MFTLRQLKIDLLSPIPILSWVVAATIAGIAGPFDSSATMDQPKLMAFWFVIITGSSVLALCGSQFVDKEQPLQKSLKSIIIAGSVFGVPNVIYILIITRLFLPVQYVDAPSIWVIYFVGTIIFVLIATIRQLLLNVEEPATPDIPFFKRLNTDLGQNLSWLRGQDHYVEVHTDKGKDMILMRFSDAVEELAGFDGLQVHRSYWVSTEAVKTVRKSASKMTLTMQDGSEIPVSRSYRDKVKAAKLG